MIKKQSKKIFDFNNEEAKNFLILNQEIESNKLLSNNPNIFSSPTNNSVKINNFRIENKLNSNNKLQTPKKIRKIHLYDKFNEEKKQKFILDSEYSLKEIGKVFSDNCFKLNENKISLFKKITESEKSNKEFSDILEKSLKEFELFDNGLLYLGSQITPDISKNNAFSSIPKSENKFENFENFSSDREAAVNKKNSNFDENCSNENIELIEFENLNIFNNSKHDKLKFVSNIQGKRKNENSNESYFKDHQINIILDEISEILKHFNDDNGFLFNYLKLNKTEITGKDANFNSIDISLEEFVKYFKDINFKMINYYFISDKSENNQMLNISCKISFCCVNDFENENFQTFYSEYFASLKFLIQNSTNNNSLILFLEEIKLEL